MLCTYEASGYPWGNYSYKDWRAGGHIDVKLCEAVIDRIWHNLETGSHCIPLDAGMKYLQPVYDDPPQQSKEHAINFLLFVLEAEEL